MLASLILLVANNGKERFGHTISEYATLPSIFVHATILYQKDQLYGDSRDQFQKGR